MSLAMPLSLPTLRRRLPLFFVLGLSLALSFVLIAARVLITGRPLFVFLLWNLFLAAIPFGLSAALSLAARPPQARLLLPVGAVWLLFFPNAPYLVTDLFHLVPHARVPYWYDLALIMSCAWNGLMLAFASLLDMHALVRRRLGFWLGWLFVAVALGLSAFGVYLGRYLRYNSWDILNDPFKLFYDIVQRILHPFHNWQAWGVTVVFWAFLLIAYATVRLLGSPRQPDADEH
ncbi:DUF1361 domain-containing protein [Hymenobacter ginsengisoli]|uniref:DUF1361 domain-containing protein n=1 Tax=Hymenobacter ginsengisoli TaxID=1051626 RepID=A0ABP8QLC7_9BACT|nr:MULTISPECIES: DUF1361 domain-containing protein [unclassified Hymenobacter]MBO2031227.1 DUF1361 domain-containing protein [Hymenobacter sp. BT559]